MSEYIRYGEEWHNEVMKNKKGIITNMLSSACRNRDEFESRWQYVEGLNKELVKQNDDLRARLALAEERERRLKEEIKKALDKLRSTSNNWQEQCLFDCNDILAALTEGK